MGMTPKDPQGEQEEMKEVVEEQTVSVDEASQALTDALNANISGEQE